MTIEPRDSLERLAVTLEAVGELDAAEKVNAFLASLDKPEPKKEEPVKRAASKPRKEG